MASDSREDVGNVRGLGIEEKAGIDALEVTAWFPIPCPRSGADRVHVADGNCMLNRTRTRARRRAGGWTPQLNTWVSPLIRLSNYFAFAPPFQAYTPLLTAFLATLLKLRDEPPSQILPFAPSLHLSFQTSPG